MKIKKGDTVEVLWPPEPGFLAENLDAAANPHNYIQVNIHSVFDTYFAKVIGMDTMQNRVTAVVRLKDTKIDGMYDGASVVSLVGGGSSWLRPGEMRKSTGP